MIHAILTAVGSYWGFFWGIWPKNVYFLTAMAAICEVVSVGLFKVSGNKGFVAVLAYILGFFVVGFYAEALKYGKITQSYPLWLVQVAVLLVISATIIFHEKINMLWVLGLVLAISGVIIIQLSIPQE